MELTKALSLLDPGNDDHWTNDGQPRMDALQELTQNGSLMRQQVRDAAPGYNRGKAAELQEAAMGLQEEVEAEEIEVEEELEADAAELGELEDEMDEQNEEEPNPEEGMRGPTIMAEDDRCVLDMPVGTVLASRDLTDEAIVEMSDKINAALAEKKAIEVDLRQLYAKNEILKRAAIAHQRRRPKNEQRTPVQSYLDAQKRSREKKMVAAQAFIAAGTTAKEVAEQLRPGAKIDQAMSQRKPAPGSQRPRRPMLAR